MAAAQGLGFDGRPKSPESPIVLDTRDSIGEYYVAAMKLAGEYARVGRHVVMQACLDVLGATAAEAVENHHNYAWLEDGLWVVRKGATPLTRAPAYIGGSMGDGAAIVRGAPNVKDNVMMGHKTAKAVEDIGAIGSAPHGAGRMMSRTKAAGKFRKGYECVVCGYFIPKASRDPFCPDHPDADVKRSRERDSSTGAIDWATVRDALAYRGVTVLGAAADEAPAAYKDLDAVLAAHSNVEVLHRLRPLGVIMAGPGVRADD
jgi:tRNA-splicing ligase RtcB